MQTWRRLAAPAVPVFPIHGKSAGCRQTIFSLIEVDAGLRMPCGTEVQPPLQTAGDSFSADYRRGCGRHALLQSSPDGERPVLSFIPANPILYRGSGKGFGFPKTPYSRYPAVREKPPMRSPDACHPVFQRGPIRSVCPAWFGVLQGRTIRLISAAGGAAPLRCRR